VEQQRDQALLGFDGIGLERQGLAQALLGTAEILGRPADRTWAISGYRIGHAGASLP
jgi:hypothetical protein